MEDKKKAVALSDDALDEISGGLIINPGYVKDQVSGMRYKLLVNQWEAFALVNELGPAGDAEKVAALQAAGMLGDPI